MFGSFFPKWKLPKGYIPKWQPQKNAISKAATSQVCPHCSARPLACYTLSTWPPSPSCSSALAPMHPAAPQKAA